MWGASLQSDNLTGATTLVLTAPSDVFAILSLIAIALAFVARVTLTEIIKRRVQPLVDAATVKKEAEAAKKALVDAKNSQLELLAEREMMIEIIEQRDRYQTENAALRIEVTQLRVGRSD